MRFYQSSVLLVAALAASNSVSINAFALPKNAQQITTTATTATTQQTPITQLSLAFGLPDEDRQLTPPPENEEGDNESTVADDTLQSLTEKLDKSKSSPKKEKGKDNKSMSFLKKIGRVGGAANKSFVNAIGSDEGSAGRAPPATGSIDTSAKKSILAYEECTVSGVVDDLTDAFPLTSSGTEWRGVTDRVMGGRSNGLLKREVDLNGRPANVLVGHISLLNNGGFLQMVTDLALDASQSSVDASDYDGIEFDVLYRPVEKDEDDNSDAVGGGEAKSSYVPGTFNMHVRTPGTFQQASYRHTFCIEASDTWETMRVPFSDFEAYGGPDMPVTLNSSELRRIGIVGIGHEMDIFLAMGGLRFYSVF